MSLATLAPGLALSRSRLFMPSNILTMLFQSAIKEDSGKTLRRSSGRLNSLSGRVIFNRKRSWMFGKTVKVRHCPATVSAVPCVW